MVPALRARGRDMGQRLIRTGTSKQARILAVHCEYTVMFRHLLSDPEQPLGVERGKDLRPTTGT